MGASAKEGLLTDGLDAILLGEDPPCCFRGIKKQVANKLGLSIFSIQLLELCFLAGFSNRLV